MSSLPPETDAVRRPARRRDHRRSAGLVALAALVAILVTLNLPTAAPDTSLTPPESEPLAVASEGQGGVSQEPVVPLAPVRAPSSAPADLDPDQGCPTTCSSQLGGSAATSEVSYNGWGNLTPYLSASPSGRASAGIAYDSNLTDPQVILFGGQGPTGTLGDTWVYRNRTTAWTNVTPAPLNSSNSPPARYGAAMIYDEFTGDVVLFGGSTGPFTGSNDPLLNDTWVYAGGNWTEVCQQCGPSPRFDSAASYDPANGDVLLFGGLTIQSGAYVTLSDTWSFANGEWSQLTMTDSPPARYGASMTFNQTSGAIVLFGGCSRAVAGTSGICAAGLNDTWTFSSAAWAPLLPGGGPAPASRTGSGLASSPESGIVLLFGGEGAAGPLADTWQLGGSGWSDLTGSLVQSAPPRDGVGLVFDNASGSRYYMMFGGVDNGTFNNETWIYPSPFSPLRITQPVAAPPVLDANQTLNLTVAVAGGAGPYSESWYGLPHGCGSADRTAISCRPSPLSGSTAIFSIYARLEDSVGSIVWSAPTIVTVNSKPIVQIEGDPGNHGVGSLNDTLIAIASGGTPPFTFAWEFGDGASGTGNPVVHLFASVGAYNVTVWANDSVGESATAPYPTVRVAAPVAVTITTVPDTSVTSGTYVTIHAFGSGGFKPYSYAWSGLPPGCVAPNVTNFSCTVSVAGTYSVGVRITDSQADTASNSTTLTVTSPALWYDSPSVWVGVGIGILLAVLIAVGIVAWRRRTRPPRGTGGTPTPP
jgi:PKD domain/Galactose oxidase, central domain